MYTITSFASGSTSEFKLVPMSTYPVNFCPVHSTYFLMGISSKTKLQTTFLPIISFSLTLTINVLSASVVKPGDPLTVLYHFDIVVGCGNVLLKVSLTYLYAFGE